MAKITFTRDADYVHNRHKTTAFKAGWSGTVKRDIQQWAIANNYGYDPTSGLDGNDIPADDRPALCVSLDTGAVQ